MNADLGILAACNTAAASDEHGDPFSGFAKSFFLAGARSLIASLWDVNTQATHQLLTLAVGRLGRSGLDRPANALREAALELMSSESLFSHPHYWAGFVSIGDCNATRHLSELSAGVHYRLWTLCGFIDVDEAA